MAIQPPEAWLNLFSTERSRGRVTSLYGIVPAIGYALGAGIYALVGYQGYAPYLAASALPAALACVSACIFLCASAARLEWQRCE